MNIKKYVGTGVVKRISKIISIIVLSLLFLIPIAGEVAVIPGDLNHICYYTDFYYNFPQEDFLYYLNDCLLFTEKPDEINLAKGLRVRLLKIVYRHQRLKKSLLKNKRDKNNIITIGVSSRRALKKATTILNLLGLTLKINEASKYKYRVMPGAGPEMVDYFHFSLLNLDRINLDLNKLKSFSLKLKESEIHVPWEYSYLEKITGLNINGSNFLELLLKNHRFSLLIGTLYRLSNKEISYIDHLIPDSRFAAWKQIYKDKKLLMGLFLLSKALRIDENQQWLLPGGTVAGPFWSKLAGIDYKKNPYKFLRELATKDEGKLNYFYIFSYFLQPDAQKLLFKGENANRVEEIYRQVSLSEEEKLIETQFPNLQDFGFFTLLYSLRVGKNKFILPAGVEKWHNVINSTQTSEGIRSNKSSKNTSQQPPDIFDLLSELIAKSRKVKKDMDAIKKFISLNTKFYQKPNLLTEEVLAWMYHNYEGYNILVDFIEKLPIQKPDTVLDLIHLVKTIEKLNRRERVLFTSLYQSLFELLSHLFKYAPESYNCDELIAKLVKIPLNPLDFYNGLFNFFKKEFKIERGKKSLVDTVLTGVQNRLLTIEKTNYRFVIKDLFKQNLEKIVQTQEVTSFSTLLEINHLMDKLLKEKEDIATARDICNKISKEFYNLPHAEISRDAPKRIRDRVMDYSRAELDKDVRSLADLISNKIFWEKIIITTNKIKRDFLIHELRHYLLSLVYAIQAKNPNLKLFINPNLVRLHDFDMENNRTPWSFCGRPEGVDFFSIYHLSGGLSRLNVVFSGKWQNHLLRLAYVHNHSHVRSVILNLLNSYPMAGGTKSVEYDAQMVDFGLELLNKWQENEDLKKELMKVCASITAGLQYRKIMSYFNERTEDHQLFFSEIKRIGEVFLNKPKYIDHSVFNRQFRQQYNAVTNPSLKDYHHERGGNIFYNSFGNLKPHSFCLFPAEVSNLFQTGWLSGELIEELKVIVSWHLYKRNLPSFLLGQVQYSYFNATFPNFYSQNHPKDYFSSYFIFRIFNKSCLDHILKNLQKEGYLKLK